MATKKENKPAEAYDQRYKEAIPSLKNRPDMSNPSNVNMGVGNITRRAAPEAKTSGIKIRGTGCATKGVMARGPMA